MSAKKIKEKLKELNKRKNDLDTLIQNSFHPFIGYMVSTKMVKQARSEIEKIEYCENILKKI